MRNKITTWLLLFVFFTLLINLIRSWFQLRARGEVIKKAYERLDQSRELQDGLDRDLARTKSQEYIEKQARERLNLGKEGEIIVILPSISEIPEATPTPIEDLSSWQRWMKVFL